MTTIPGLVPALQPGAFEGGQYSANGQATTSNLFLVDGQFNNDSRLGGSQGNPGAHLARLDGGISSADAPAWRGDGGSTGVVVNSVSRSGTNNVFGRAFEYYKGNALQATDYFLKQAGEENPDSSSHIFGGHIGGPIVQNRLFYFGNLEYTHAKEAAILNFPADAAPSSDAVFELHEVHRTEHLPPARLSGVDESPHQVQLVARGHPDAERRARGRPRDPRRRAI